MSKNSIGEDLPFRVTEDLRGRYRALKHHMHCHGTINQMAQVSFLCKLATDKPLFVSNTHRCGNKRNYHGVSDDFKI